MTVMLPHVTLYSEISLDGKIEGLLADIGRYYTRSFRWHADAIMKTRQMKPGYPMFFRVRRIPCPFQISGRLTLVAWGELKARYGPVMAHAARHDAGFPAGAYFGWILPALGLDPGPISARLLAAWAPYTALALDESRLAASAELGFLQQAGGGDYFLTRAGREAAGRITAAAYDFMGTLQPLPEASLARLLDLLHRLVEACLAAPEPPGQWHVRLSRRTDPGEMAPIVARIDQYFTDLNAYHNDASLAVWQPYGVSGAAWEAFTLPLARRCLYAGRTVRQAGLPRPLPGDLRRRCAGGRCARVGR